MSQAAVGFSANILLAGKASQRLFGLGVVATVVYFAAAFIWGTRGEDGDLPSVMFQFGYNFSAWFWTVAVLGFGQQYLNGKNALLRYANEAAYPFYVLHQTAIVVIGYYAVEWPVDALPKFALVATVGLYDVLVRRTAVTRFLFGVKPAAPKGTEPRSLDTPA